MPEHPGVGDRANVLARTTGHEVADAVAVDIPVDDGNVDAVDRAVRVKGQVTSP
ncbi:hypothetical protein [Actinopolymorpha sp. B9G3]|uniref:hypothetical protein n=1 Tax=Actinopolymorpha sp. B9G3 TaxID=3158970 RepID=UPI0032D94B00